MKTPLEPGVLRMTQTLALLQVAGIPLLRRGVGASEGIAVPLAQWLLVTMPVPLFLLVFTWAPWAQRRLGRAFLPAVIVIAALNLVGEKYLTLVWLVPPAQRELDVLLLVVRLWFMLHVLTLLVAWQYTLRWALVAALGLSFADGMLSRPFVPTASPLHPLFLMLIVARTATVTSVALGVGWLLVHQREQRRALAAANRQLTHFAATAELLAATRERNRLARELHDTLAHSLSAVAVQLEAVHALWDADSVEARNRLVGAQDTTRTGLREARRALRSLRASPLEDVGLAVAVGDLARTAAARAGLDLDLAIASDLDGLASEREQGVYRVAAEAVENVVRHAGATRLCVALARVGEEFTLTIADNGCGFALTTIDRDAHFGLRGMQERVALLGGRLDVDSRPRCGTTVRVTLT